jgi:hypothetical protein
MLFFHLVSTKSINKYLIDKDNKKKTKMNSEYAWVHSKSIFSKEVRIVQGLVIQSPLGS